MELAATIPRSLRAPSPRARIEAVQADALTGDALEQLAVG